MKQTKSNVRSSWQQHDTVYWRLYEGTHQRYNAYSRSEQSTENSVTMKSQATVVITVTDRQTDAPHGGCVCTQRHSVHVTHTHDIQQKVHHSHHIRDRHVWVFTCSKSSSRDVWGLSVPLPASYSVHCWRSISSLSFSRVNHNVVDRTSSAQ